MSDAIIVVCYDVAYCMYNVSSQANVLRECVWVASVITLAAPATRCRIALGRTLLHLPKSKLTVRSTKLLLLRSTDFSFDEDCSACKSNMCIILCLYSRNPPQTVRGKQRHVQQLVSLKISSVAKTSRRYRDTGSV